MLSQKIRTPLTAAALLLVLSACGGGGTDASNPTSDGSIKAADQSPGETTLTIPGTTSAERVATQSATEAAAGIDSTLPKVRGGAPEAADSPTGASTRDETDTASAQPPISHAGGVTGSVLMTMLFQKACAEPRQTQGLYGPRMDPAAYELPQVFADLRVSPESYQEIQRGKPLFDTVCDPNFATFRLPVAHAFSLKLFSQRHWLHDYAGRPAPRRDFRKLEAEIPVTSVKWTILQKDITVNGQPFTSEGNGFAFNPIFRKIDFGVLAEWKREGDSLRLMLLPGTVDEEAKLCWNANLADVKRLQCTTWRAPQNWQVGQPLEMTDQYIVDDRSTYPNESGMVFLHSKTY